MFEVQMLIPVTDNSGEEFSETHFAVFHAAILAAFGGYSLIPFEIVGSWVNEWGVTYYDRSRCYAVAVVSIARGATVAELAAFAKGHFRQEAIAIRYLGQLEII